MALEEQMRQAPEQDGALSEEEEADLAIAVNIGKQLLDEGGGQVIDQALEESSDPAQVIGQFVMQMGSQMEEELPEGLTLSKRIYMAEGGGVEQIMDYLQEQWDVPKDVTDRAEIFIGTTAQEIAAQQAGGQPQEAVPAEQPAQPMAPSLPQGGV